ncbi:hypothetical protein [Planomicrobium okeanokoites]|uniref:Transposase n=1 Tax=Planomicrobium okeanokoites TaxID=244 RepID=A0ABV7KT72_PLAOK|nr:hypothetical protein [Planomicrobium okeanokoites]
MNLLGIIAWFFIRCSIILRFGICGRLNQFAGDKKNLRAIKMICGRLKNYIGVQQKYRSEKEISSFNFLANKIHRLQKLKKGKSDLFCVRLKNSYFLFRKLVKKKYK